MSWLVSHLVTTSALVAVVWLVCLALSRRPAFQHALWAVVLLKFLVPPAIAWPWRFSDVTGFIASALMASTKTPHAIEQPLVQGAAWSTTTIESVGSVSLSAASTYWLALAWLSVALGLTIRAAYQIGRQASLVLQAQAAPEQLTREVERTAASIGLRTIPVVLSENLDSPVIWCWGRPRLLWPAAWCGVADVERRRGVLVHELAHVKRRDHWVAWLSLVACIVWWWNPLVWVTRRRLDAAAEMACDAWAMNLIPDCRGEFAQTLLELSTLRAAEPSLALGVVSGRFKFLERRVAMILSESVSNRLSWPAVGVVLLIAALALPSWSLGQVPVPPVPDWPPMPGAPQLPPAPPLFMPAPPEPAPPSNTEPGAGPFQGDDRFQMFIAENEPRADLNEAMAPMNRKVYLHPTPVVDFADIAECKATPDENNFDHDGNPAYQLEVVFTPAGAKKMAKATRENMHKGLAIMVSGAVGWVPTIQAEIGDKAQISGGLTRRDAFSLVKFLSRPAPLPAPPH